ncbi:anti-sigma factor RsbA family regulatory protein [Streptacidiphilus monticola]
MTGTAPVQGFVHPALFYEGQDAYLAGTVPFLRQGLAAGEPAAVAAPPAQLGWLRRALGADAERVVLIDMTDAGRNPGRIIPQVLRGFADAHPASRVRIIGEPIWPGRTTLEYPACVQHEALINAAFADREVTILCPYDTAGLDADALDDALTTHPVVIDDKGEWASDRYDPGARWPATTTCRPCRRTPPSTASAPGRSRRRATSRLPRPAHWG